MFAGSFSAVLRRADKSFLRAVWECGKGHSFVEQDKGPAVRYGIFAEFPNELAPFSLWRWS
jgi:hypothetical protein